MIYQLLDALRQRPAMYLGEKSVTHLYAFLLGWDYGRRTCNLPLQEDDLAFQSFSGWVRKQCDLPGYQSWLQLALFPSGNEEQGVDLFFEWLGAFQQRKAPGDFLPMRRNDIPVIAPTELLGAIKKQPTVFLGAKSGKRLQMFLTGYMLVAKSLEELLPSEFLFQWVPMRYHFKIPSEYNGWTLMHLFSEDDAASFDLFFELLETFQHTPVRKHVGIEQIRDQRGAARGEQPPCPKIVRGQERLTPEQTAYARHFAQRRIVAMLSPKIINEKKAEELLRQAYRVAGLELPAIRWFDSPIAFALALSEVVWDSAWDLARASLWKAVWASAPDLFSSYSHSLLSPVRSSVEYEIGYEIRSSIQSKVWPPVRAAVSDSVPDASSDLVWASVSAYYDVDWLSFYRFFHEVFENNDLIHLALFNEMVSGYRLDSKQACLVRKPIRIKRDKQGRLHSVDGMCLQYRDGWGLYAWHGTRVQFASE